MVAVMSVLPAQAEEIKGLKAQASSWKHWGAPERLTDNDITTAWVGGRTGVGPGKMLTFTLPQVSTVSRIRIANGNQGANLFNDFRCITAGVLVLQDEAVYSFKLKPEVGEQDIVFPQVSVGAFSIIITEVSPSVGVKLPGDGKVAVSEVRAFDDGGGAASNVAAASLSSIGAAKAPPAPVKSANPKDPKQNPYFSAIKPGATFLLASVPASDNLEPGKVHEKLWPAFVDLVHGYFKGLVRMDDDFIPLFATDIQQREKRVLAELKDEIRSKRLYEGLRSAEVDTSGLSLNRPIVRGASAILRVHGICRYTVDGKAFDFPVDMTFSFIDENGWHINGAQSKRR
ncbi:hypothetical protein [Pseudodesulfovibrio sp. zrk46]|uniref:NADase-type glycan-binding domain-containing protein n=1 Tax=Pseudodesulfovibrio sp. zrk46 TaxID=2725288 RepID=UPI0014492AC5|nr:hypothetical protein [Pseudodesulfovibrio sp. zrk46]QJB56981.1 hypothetical protein HFN16_11470 [Pseudodesulfovibrio sp. zrk46]